MAGMRLVYVSPVPWWSFAQRPHKFVEWFHERTGADVFWIDPYPARLPTWRDLARLWSHDVGMQYLNQAPPPWLSLRQPFALPLEPVPVLAGVNRRFWRDIAREVKSFADGQQAMLVIGKPSLLAQDLMAGPSWQRVVYDAMDDFPAFFGGLSRVAMAAREEKIAGQATDVWASSTPLLQRWSRLRAETRLVPNGLARDSVAGLFRRSTAPAPVFGYVGTIAQWFDWDWVIRLARSYGQTTVRLIGPRHGPQPAQLPPNIELHPPCDHRNALERMQHFDVGLIPFRRNRLTDAVDPVKYYEYKALGLAVLCTDFGQMRWRHDEEGVFVAGENAEFRPVVDASLAYRATPEAAERFRQQHGWEAVFDRAGLLNR